MSIFRRRLMMQSKAQPLECPYITDGLVFWLDGLNKGASDGRWVDLVKRIKFTNNNVESLDDGWRFNGTSSYFTTSSQIGYGADYTFEFCINFAVRGNVTVMAFGPQTIKYSPMVYVQNGSNFTFMQNTNTYSFTLSLNTNYSISANLSRLVINGVSPISPSSKTDYWNNTGNYIGRRLSRDYFKGVIHGIRMYNRRLSLEEQQFNISVDNERFNLGLEL